MRKLIYSLVALTAFLPGVFAQNALPFMRINRDPVTSALGGAQVTSGLYNPAATPFTGSDVVLSFQNWAPTSTKASHVNLLGGVKLGEKLGLTVLAAYQMGEEFQTMDASGNTGASFRPSDVLIGLGGGFAFTDALSAGVNLKFVNSAYASGLSGSAFAADLYVMYAAANLKLSGGVSSLGGAVKSGSNSYALPTSITAGAGYDLAFGTSAVKVMADFDYFFAGGVSAALGAQYGWNDMVFVRAGGHLGVKNVPVPSYVSFGLGAKFAGFHADVSMLVASKTVGNSLNLGIGYCF